MMGHRQVEQAALFYEFSLERHVPADHLLRSIDRFVELGELRRELAPFYSTIGRPSIDPELLIRMLLVGYCFGIRSERRLCEEVHLNLAYRWFCRLGLDGEVPDHSTFSKNRHGRFRESDLLRQLFETVVRRCMAEGLVGGEGFAVDASLIKAEANRQNGIEGEKGLPRRQPSRAIEEYLAVLDDAAFGAAHRSNAEVHLAGRSGGALDRRPWGQAFFAYSDQLSDRPRQRGHRRCRAVDRDPAGRGHAPPGRMIERPKSASVSSPPALWATAPMARPRCSTGWCTSTASSPMSRCSTNRARQDGTFSRGDFTYDHAGDVYYCPGGKTLTTTGSLSNDGATLRYRASKYDCQACRLKPRCCPKESGPVRAAIDLRRGPRHGAPNRQDRGKAVSRRLRKKVEMLFAHLKRILKLDRLRLRGPNGARDEFLLAATAQNLRKLAKLIPAPDLKPA